MQGKVRTIEDRFAIIEVGEDQYPVIFPLRHLPGGIKEGDILKIDIQVDREASTKYRSKVTSIEDKRKRERN